MNTAGSCHVCIRECRPGQSFCGRRDGAGNLVLRNRWCAMRVDSLFDKPITHFSENMKVLSLGSWGCNLRCLGCQNPRLSWATSGEGLGYVDMAPGTVIRMALEKGCEGICYTYNEPAILVEDVMSVASAAKGAGLRNFFVTNSTLTPRSVEMIAPWLDAVAADIKSLEDDFYYRYCGAEGIAWAAAKILACIKAFHDAGCHVEVRTNVIPGGNDTQSGLAAIAHWIKMNLGEGTPWHITRFFPAHKLAHLDATPVEVLERARDVSLADGLKRVHVYRDKGCDCAAESDLIVPHAPTEPALAKKCSCCGGG